MIGIFLFAVNAVLPIILVIMLGYFLKRTGFLDDVFLKTGNKLVFRVALPSLLFYNVYGISRISDINWGTVIFALAMVLILFFLGLIFVTFFVKEKRRKGPVLQCVFRSNFAIIGLSLAGSIGSGGALATAAVLSAFTIPLFNVLAVIALSMYSGGSERADVRGILKSIVTNPLITGVALGFLCLIIRGILPHDPLGEPVFSLKENLPALYTAIGWMAELASPFALIVLGGQFEISAFGKMKYEIISATLWRIVAAPALAIGAAVLLTVCNIAAFTADHFPAYIALFGSPVAVSSAIMATEMGSDGELAGQLVVWTTIGSAFTIFVTVVILRSAGLI